MTIFYIISATVIISLFSLIGVFFISIKESVIKRILFLLVAFSTGTMLGGAFLHLLPEAISQIGPDLALRFTLAAFIGFFLIEKIIHWRHCHDETCGVHSFGFITLFGDAIHNFIDGMIMASSFLVSVPLGVATTFALALHEIPQEIGDFGVLLHAGFSRKKALMSNFFVALTSVFGGLVGYFISTRIDFIIPYSIAIAAGGFLYIATSDLMPELIKEAAPKKSLRSFLLFIVGIGVIYVFALFE